MTTNNIDILHSINNNNCCAADDCICVDGNKCVGGVCKLRPFVIDPPHMVLMDSEADAMAPSVKRVKRETRRPQKTSEQRAIDRKKKVDGKPLNKILEESSSSSQSSIDVESSIKKISRDRLVQEAMKYNLPIVRKHTKPQMFESIVNKMVLLKLEELIG